MLNCEHCGALFEPRRTGGEPQRFCSRVCQNRARQKKRPRLRSSNDIHITMDPEDMEYVRDKSKKTNISISEIIRTYACWGIELEKQDETR